MSNAYLVRVAYEAVLTLDVWMEERSTIKLVGSYVLQLVRYSIKQMSE